MKSSKAVTCMYLIIPDMPLFLYNNSICNVIPMFHPMHVYVHTVTVMLCTHMMGESQQL